MISNKFADLVILHNLDASLHLRQRATAEDVWGVCPKLGMELCLND